MSTSIKRLFPFLMMFLLLAIHPGCSDESGGGCPLCPSQSNIDTVIVAKFLGPYYPQLVVGDREYGPDRGPTVFLKGKLYIEEETALMCYAFMSAQENGGTTRGEIEANELLYQAPSG